VQDASLKVSGGLPKAVKNEEIAGDKAPEAKKSGKHQIITKGSMPVEMCHESVFMDSRLQATQASRYQPSKIQKINSQLLREPATPYGSCGTTKVYHST
jgi:hypothetical protein